MPGLKKICGNYLIGVIDLENVIDLIKLSRTYNLPRIEVSCNEFIAKHLEEVNFTYSYFIFISLTCNFKL